MTKPTVDDLPPGPVIVTEHAQPHAAQVRFWADWICDQPGEPGNGTAELAATELRAAAERLSATCETCHYHTDSDWQCGAGVVRPGRYRDGIPVNKFGCNRHIPLPREAPGTETP